MNDDMWPIGSKMIQSVASDVSHRAKEELARGLIPWSPAGAGLCPVHDEVAEGEILIDPVRVIAGRAIPVYKPGMPPGEYVVEGELADKMREQELARLLMQLRRDR